VTLTFDLLTPGVRFSLLLLLVCLFFLSRYLKNRCSWDHKTWHRNVPRWLDESLKPKRSKGQKSRSWVNKSVSLFRQNAVSPLAAYVSHAWFSLVQCSAVQAVLATPGFSCVTSRGRCYYRDTLTTSDRETAGFTVRGVFRSQPAAKTFALLWVLASIVTVVLCVVRYVYNGCTDLVPIGARCRHHHGNAYLLSRQARCGYIIFYCSFVSFFLYLFVYVWLLISPQRIKLAASNFARRFIGV